MHGVVMLIRKDHSFQHIPVQMNITPRADTKTAEAATGRIILILLNKQLYLVGTYTPNSGRGDAVKLQYRTQMWDPTFFKLLDQLRSNGPTMWIGDINVALDEIDVSNPKTMCKYAGFIQEERNNFRSLLSTGNWIDIWRQQHPTDKVYTWCGNPPRPNYGLRLDNIIVSQSLVSNILNTFMLSECPISADHIPVGCYVKFK
jgi:exodeoxyribonuclease-3